MWDIWIPFRQQEKLLKIIILDILCINGIKILKTDNRFLETGLSAALVCFWGRVWTWASKSKKGQAAKINC